MRITAMGQVTIPQNVREQLGLLPNTEVEFVVEGRSARIVKVRAGKGTTRGQRAVRSLRGRAKVPMTTDQVMALTRGPTSRESS